MVEFLSVLGLVHIQLLLQKGVQLLPGHIRIFLRLDDPAHIGLHFALPAHIAPPGLDAVAALNTEDGQGQTQLFHQRGDGRITVTGQTAEGAVPLGGKTYGTALPGNLDAVAYRIHIGGLLLDGNGCHRPPQQRGQKA